MRFRWRITRRRVPRRAAVSRSWCRCPRLAPQERAMLRSVAREVAGHQPQVDVPRVDVGVPLNRVRHCRLDPRAHAVAQTHRRTERLEGWSPTDGRRRAAAAGASDVSFDEYLAPFRARHPPPRAQRAGAGGCARGAVPDIRNDAAAQRLRRGIARMAGGSRIRRHRWPDGLWLPVGRRPGQPASDVARAAPAPVRRRLLLGRRVPHDRTAPRRSGFAWQSALPPDDGVHPRRPRAVVDAGGDYDAPA